MLAAMCALAVGWGGGPWGSAPWGSGAAPDLDMVSAEAVKENVVRVGFNIPPLFTQLLDPADASNPARFAVTAVGGVGIDGEAVRDVTVVAVELAGGEGTLLDLWVDRAFSHWPCVYEITATGLVSSLGSGLGASSRQFDAVQRGMPPRLVEQASASKDFANPQVRSALFDPLPNAADATSLLLGTYQVDGSGDYANDVGLTSYKKRVIRRLCTKKGKFLWLPNYGVSLPSSAGKLARSATREALATDAEDQIKQEPETVEVKVTTSVDANGICRFVVKARTTLGPANLTVPTLVGV